MPVERKNLKKMLTFAGRLIGLLALTLVVRTILKEFHAIPEFTVNGISIGLVAISVVFWFVSTAVLGSYIWGLYLRDFGIQIREVTAFWIIGVSQIAKYLPSNVLHFAGQISLSRRVKIPTVKAVSTMIIQTVVSIIAPAILVVIGIALRPDTLDSLSLITSHSKLMVGILGGVALLFIIVIVVSSSLRKRFLEYMRSIRPASLVWGLLLIVIKFIGFGLLLELLAQHIWGAAAPNWFTFSWGFSLAWIAGFLIPGLPGGLGVREAVFTALFGAALGDGLAVGLAVLIRVISSLGDLLAFGIATLLAKTKGASSTQVVHIS